MHLRTYKAEKLPCVVTVWDEYTPLYGKVCMWEERNENEMCKVSHNGKIDWVHRKYIAIGDNSEAEMNG
jgi:hypothetical protein